MEKDHGDWRAGVDIHSVQERSDVESQWADTESSRSSCSQQGAPRPWLREEEDDVKIDIHNVEEETYDSSYDAIAEASLELAIQLAIQSGETFGPEEVPLEASSEFLAAVEDMEADIPRPPDLDSASLSDLRPEDIGPKLSI